MPYKEKIAWLTLLAMVVTFGPYFTLVALDTSPATAMPDLPSLWRLGIALGAQAVIVITGHIILAMRNKEDAGLPADERDLAIAHRSMARAYYVLICGMILVGFVMPFESAGWSLINAALFMIALSELTHYGSIIAGYRGFARSGRLA